MLYYLAYEYEQAGDLRNAQAAHYQLIQKAPTSKYVPNAYLAFGELFFAEAQGDPSKAFTIARCSGVISFGRSRVASSAEPSRARAPGRLPAVRRPASPLCDSS